MTTYRDRPTKQPASRPASQPQNAPAGFAESRAKLLSDHLTTGIRFWNCRRMNIRKYWSHDIGVSCGHSTVNLACREILCKKALTFWHCLPWLLTSNPFPQVKHSLIQPQQKNKKGKKRIQISRSSDVVLQSFETNKRYLCVDSRTQ